MASKTQILTIYKRILKESQNIPNYNFRSYAIRRVRDAFRHNKSLTESTLIKKEYDFAKENLEIIKRQVTIGHMFHSDKLVIENMR